MTDRRYTEAEMAEIFERATRESQDREASSRALARSEGLTLSELQDIGEEVGISRDAVARSAATLAFTGSTDGVERVVGAPLRISRNVALPRELTEPEWHRTVALLRDTFDATGKITETGAFREWRNGNLRVALEPAEDGARLRMRTRRGGGEALPVAGAVVAGTAIVAGLMGVLASGSFAEAASLLTLGVGLWTLGYFNLKGWSRRRLEQFRELGERIAAMASGPGPEEVGRIGEGEGGEA